VKLVILDRDGVINVDSDRYIKSPAEWQPIPGSLEAIALLNQNGFRVAVATNQSGLGRGLFDMATFNAMNAKMMDMLFRVGGRIDALFFCPHTDADGCDCRKPKAGLFHAIASRFHTELNGVPAIGDAIRDIEAAASAGARPILVMTGKGPRTRKDPALARGTPVFADLAEAARHLVAEDR